MAIKLQLHEFPEVKPVPSRFRNALGKYRITIDKACNNCGFCAKLCPYGVYKAGAKRPRVAAEQFCIGFPCSANDFYCVNRCPEKAIQLSLNPSFEILGAMGIREIRRLRGEMGRAMFYDDLEKDLFAVLGKRK